MGYFHALNWAFLSSLIRKYMLWEGFYYDFSTKKVSASGGFDPWPPPRGSATLDPRQGTLLPEPRGNFAPSNNLPWPRPWYRVLFIFIPKGSFIIPKIFIPKGHFDDPSE